MLMAALNLAILTSLIMHKSHSTKMMEFRHIFLKKKQQQQQETNNNLFLKKKKIKKSQL